MVNLTFEAAAAAYAKSPGHTIVGVLAPAAVDNSAVRIGFAASFDKGVTFANVTTDVEGSSLLYRPIFTLGEFLVLDPTIMYALEGADEIRLTLYASNGTTEASQTETTVGLVLGKVRPE
jgi:hypothetical protein